MNGSDKFNHYSKSMAETFGSLCDKLTIVKLKEWHTQDSQRLSSLAQQATQLQAEIDELLGKAISGEIPIGRLRFASNKVYNEKGNEIAKVVGTIGQIFASLASINCDLWHEQEKVYAFKDVPPEEKDVVVGALAKLNLSRNRCIDEIDRLLANAISIGNAGDPLFACA